MRTVHYRRFAVPPAGTGGLLLRRAPSIGRALLRVLAIVAIIAGIVAMHSLGLGHGPMATGHTGHAAHAVATTAEVVAELGSPGHGTAAMCLAVLPLLLLLTARLWGWRVRSQTHDVRRPGVHGFVPGNRAPPALLCPSLLKLCILRT